MQMVSMIGIAQKLRAIPTNPIQYKLPLGSQELTLNPYLGKEITLFFKGKISCIHCHKPIKKSYSQGYCFPCSQKLAKCDFCIVRPEKCHFHLGTCREPEWGKSNCFIPHIVYLANSSGLKVGITRETQIPTRWIDQGAIEALPIMRVNSRYHSGLIEAFIKKNMSDKTDWRKMLKGNIEKVDLIKKRDELLHEYHADFNNLEVDKEILSQKTIVEFDYPVLEYPQKISSINIEKTPEVSGKLQGIKGQYLILDVGVINIRALTGYELTFFSEESIDNGQVPINVIDPSSDMDSSLTGNPHNL